MRTVIFATIVVLVLFSFSVEDHLNAQNVRRARKPRVRSVEEIDTTTPEERRELIEECSTPERPKPDVEAGRIGNALLCGKAISLPKPDYPEEAKAQNVSGIVAIEIVIDEKGRVIWANPVDGHPLLQRAAWKAACQSRHSPIKISGRAVKAAGTISYNFVSQ